MTERTRPGWERWLALAAIAYVVVHFFTLTVGTDPGAGVRATQTAFTHSAAQQTASGLLFQVGGILILLFALSLRAHLRRAEDEPNSLSSVVLGAAFASTVLAFVASALTFALESKVAKLGDPNLTYALFQLWWANFIGSTLMLGIMALAASALALVTRMMPRWVGALGIACGLALAGGCLVFYPSGAVVQGPADGVAYIGEILFAVWAIASGVVILRGRRAARAVEGAELRVESALAR